MLDLALERCSAWWHAPISATRRPLPSPINRTIVEPDPNFPAADKFLSTFKQPETAAQIAERKRQQSQGTIDAINKTDDDQVAASRKTGDERVAMDNVVSVLSGLTGSTEANRMRTNLLQAGDKEIDDRLRFCRQ